MVLLSSPFTTKHRSTAQVMRTVIYATFPGLAALIFFFGWGTLIQLVLAIAFALASEALVLKMRGRTIGPSLNDYSAILTAVLLAMAIPPLAPWWISFIGIGFAIIIAKQLYGGLGLNPFNPAMIGYVLLLISFPVEMTSWVPAQGFLSHQLSFSDTLSVIFSGQTSLGVSLAQARELVDGYTAATALDLVKTDYKLGLTTETIFGFQPDFGKAVLSQEHNTHISMLGQLGGQGWEFVNLAFLGGGLFLLITKIIDWRIPFSFLTALAAIAFIFNLIAPESYPPFWFHLFSGGTMLGAFFIATDPVTATTTTKGRLIYGALIGILIYIIRTFGGYPDAIAFSVLLLNMAAPTIDQYCRPRAYGYKTGGN